MNPQRHSQVSALSMLLVLAAAAPSAEPIDIGSRRELFVDRYLVERLDGVRLELHRPVRREVVFRTDAPWEGNGSAYQSVFQDGDRFRMYYRGGHHPNSKAYQSNKNSWETLCLAESTDGIHWTRAELGIVEFRGSIKNNLVLDHSSIRKSNLDRLGPMWLSYMGGTWVSNVGLHTGKSPLKQLDPDHPICRGWKEYEGDADLALPEKPKE